MARKRNIGEVGFGKYSAHSPRGWVSYPALGDVRVALLEKAMTGEELPHNLFLVADNGGGSQVRIGYDEVNWEDLKFYLEKYK